MASPFSMFRRNQKVMLVALTLLAMIAFVILPTFMDMPGLQGGPKDEVIVSTDRYGKLKQSDIRELIYDRNRIRGVMKDILNLVYSSQGQANLALDFFNRMGGDRKEVTASEVVDTWLQAHYAEELGMIVSDEAINDFIREVTEGRVTGEQLDAMLRQHAMTETELFRILRGELLAKNLVDTMLPSLSVVTPGQRWDYFLRTRRQADIAVVPVAVKNYIDQVKAPDDKMLEEFFNAARENEWPPYSSTPGFSEPARVKIAYLAINPSEIAEKLISEQAVLKEYEANKDKYTLPKIKEQPAAEAPAEKGKVEEAAKPEEKPAASEAVPTVEEKAPSTPAASGAVPAVEEKTPLKTEELKKEAPKPDRSNGAPSTPFRLVAMADEKVNEKPPGEKPAGEGAKDDKPTQPPIKPEEEAKPAADPEPLPPKSDATGPSEELKQQIRMTLAHKKVGDLLDQVLLRLTKYREAIVTGGASASPPDFAALANENHMKLVETGLLPPWELARLELADTVSESRMPFVQAAIESSVNVPTSAFSMRGNVYVWWPTEKQKASTPDWNEPGIRDRVVNVWKQIEARKLAEEAAKKLAEEAKEAKKPLDELFGGRNDLSVVKPAPFTWMTSRGLPTLLQPASLEMSDVEHIDFAGYEFMRTVFGLEPGGVGVAMNQPKTTVYVIRANDFTPSEPELWDRFITTRFETYAQMAGQHAQQTFKQWELQVQEAAGMLWERPFETKEESAK